MQLKDNLMRVAICDDNPTALEWCYKELLKNENLVSDGLVIDRFHSGSELIFKYDDLNGILDLVYLDIVMPGIDGIETAGQLRELGYLGDIIFFSGTIDYAISGYDYEAIGYLVKEKTSSCRFTETFKRAVSRRKERNSEVILLRCAGETKVIDIDSIRYFEVMKRITTVYYGDESFSFYSPLAKLAEELTGKNFVRIHRAYLVNLKYISRMSLREVILSDGTELPAGQKYIKKIKSD